ncbi:heat shock factor binding protein 1-domain-containing protein [Fomitopsis betulina]|nr:heat shock factor binding protein 1-domain-containing protein [Fomitopsis betulina]
MPPPSSSPALPLNVSAAGAPSKLPAPSGSAAAPSSAKNANPGDISSPHELTAFVESLLEQLDTKFDDMSSQILDRMMQMSTRVDALEAAIQDIINGDTVPPGPPSMPQSPGLAQRRSGGV